MKFSEKQVEQYASLIEKRIESMEEDFQKPWIDTNLGRPRNLDGRPYASNGLNSLILNLHSSTKGYETPIYTTFFKAKEEDIRIKPGEKGILVSYMGHHIKDKETDKSISPEEYRELSEEEQSKYKVVPYSKTSTVFNLDQTNIRESRPDLWAKIEQETRVFKASISRDNNFVHETLGKMIDENQWIIPIKHSLESSAYYDRKNQYIHLPNRELFINNESYYATALHEMAHSTDKPLKRDSSNYGREELVAELSASIVASNYEYPKTIQDNNVQYIKTWLSNMKEDPSYLSNILEDVHKSSNFIAKEIDSKYKLSTEASQETTKSLDIPSEKRLGVSQDSVEEKQANKAMMNLYANSHLMTSEYLTENGIKDSKILSLVEERQKLIKGYMIDEDPKLIIQREELEDKIRNVVSNLYKIPELPTRIQKEDLISRHLEQATQAPSPIDKQNIVHIATYRDINLTIKEENTPENLSRLKRDGVDFQEKGSLLEYEARIRYREGWSMENTQENKELLSDLKISPIPYGRDKLFIPSTDKNIGELIHHTDKIQPIYGIGTLPKLQESSLEERLNNNPNLSAEDRQSLLSGKTIFRPESSDSDINKVYYIDKNLHQLRTIDTHHLFVPRELSGIKLNENQRNDLREGKPITFLDQENHVYHRAQINLREDNSIKLEYKTSLNEQFKDIPTVQSPDSEKEKYIALKGAMGINDIWGREGLKMERDTFLERYKVQETYREFLRLNQQGEPGITFEQNKEIREAFQPENQKSVSYQR